MVSGLIPVVGLPLPFFTKGGSSLLCFSIMLGFIFSAKGFLEHEKTILLLFLAFNVMSNITERDDVQTFINNTVETFLFNP